MAWLLISRQSRRQAIGWSLAGAATAGAAGLLGGLAVAPGALVWESLGFVSFVVCVGRALERWRVDEIVFDHPRRMLEARRGSASTESPTPIGAASSVRGAMSDRNASPRHRGALAGSAFLARRAPALGRSARPRA
jgi:hypothetical protein